MAKYFGFMVPRPGGTYDIVVVSREADAEALREFEQLTGVVRELQPLAIALAATEGDYLALAGLPDAQAMRLNEIGNANVPVPVVVDLLIDSTRVLSAFLASASGLLGQATKYVSRVIGDDTPAGAAWHRLRQELHGSVVGYRILYELRNYAQHYALPVSAVDVRGELNADDQMRFVAGAHVNRDQLLASGFDWRQRTADLEAQQPEFDILPLARDYFRCLQELLTLLASYRAPALLECKAYLAAVRRVLKAPATARIYLFEYPADRAEGPPAGGMIVPEEQFVWMLQVLFRRDLVELQPDLGVG